MSAPRRILCAIAAAALLGSLQASAKPYWLRGVDSNETDFLNPDVAFRVGGRLEGNTVLVRWVIADGYYLYRSRISFAPESPDLELGSPRFPDGIRKNDPYFGPQEIYTQQVAVPVPFTRADAGAHPVQIKVTYQGCAEAGLCYPPITKVIYPGLASQAPEPNAANPPKGWEIIAILAGAALFLLSGFTLRKGRKLATPP